MAVGGWCGKKQGLGRGAAKSILGGVVPRGALRENFPSTVALPSRRHAACARYL